MKYICPQKNSLEKDIELGLGKSHIAKKYGVTIPVINRWFKEAKISVPSYYGRKYFKTQEEEDAAIEKLNVFSHRSISISEISRQTGIPRHMIKQLRAENKVKLKTKFDFWETEFQKIVSHLNFYVVENKTKTLKTIADENNISVEQLKKAFKVNNVPVQLHSYNKSKGENEIKEFIISLGENCYSAMLEKTFEIDCYVPSKKFGLEYCGEFWHRFIPSKNNRHYHKHKKDFASKRGINVLTIFENEWINKQSIIKSIIKSKLGYTKRLYARKCCVKEICGYDAKNFHERNHISGYTNSSVNIGLFYDNALVSVLSLTKSRFDKNFQYEISRFSSNLDTTVTGGLGKCFSYFVKHYNPKSCMTYVDLRFGEGKSYEKIGFKFIGSTVPNYFYFHKNVGELENRMKYQKNKLKNMPGYSKHKSEYEIMEEAGYYRLYDCGNKKYGWISSHT